MPLMLRANLKMAGGTLWKGDVTHDPWHPETNGTVVRQIMFPRGAISHIRGHLQASSLLLVYQSVSLPILRAFFWVCQSVKNKLLQI